MTELSHQMTSVERVNEYAKQPQEPPVETIPKLRPPPEWPSQGRIEFCNFSLKEEGEEEEKVLSDVNLIIQPKVNWVESFPLLFWPITGRC